MKRQLIVVLIGLLGGIITALIVRKLVELPFGPYEGNWARYLTGMSITSFLGMLAVNIPVLLAAQSPARFPKKTVIKIVTFFAAFIGAAAAAGMFITLLFVNQGDFLRGQNIIKVAFFVVLCAGINAFAFRIGIRYRGFDRERETSTAGAERFQVKMKAQTLERLRGHQDRR